MKIRLLPAACCFLAGFVVIPTQAGVEIVASKSLTVQPDGPRSGDPGTKYFNIQGKDNQKYASFGVLVFEIPKEIRDKKVKDVTLTMVQSIPKFAKDGAICFFLATDLDAPENLKFDPNAPDGVGSQIKPLHALGSGKFKKIETGKTETLSINVDDTVRERMEKGGKFFLIVVPADSTVAATYFGAGEAAKENRPRLTLDLP
jgi:hypothetical protein